MLRRKELAEFPQMTNHVKVIMDNYRIVTSQLKSFLTQGTKYGAWRRTVDKPLPEPMIAIFYSAILGSEGRIPYASKLSLLHTFLASVQVHYINSLELFAMNLVFPEGFLDSKSHIICMWNKCCTCADTWLNLICIAIPNIPVYNNVRHDADYNIWHGFLMLLCGIMILNTDDTDCEIWQPFEGQKDKESDKDVKFQPIELNERCHH